MNNELSPFSQVPPAPVETSDTLRSKAKQYMIQSGVHGLMADRIVECIIAAAVMEAVGLMKQAMADVAKESAKESRRG